MEKRLKGEREIKREREKEREREVYYEIKANQTACKNIISYPSKRQPIEIETKSGFFYSYSGGTAAAMVLIFG
jgi:hypothetical protein